MICFINRSTVDYDVRLQKYVQSCIDTNTDYIVISWDRTKQCSKVYPNEYQYKVNCPYGTGRKNKLAMIGWAFYVIYHLLFKINRYKVIHACNVENAMLAYPFKLFGKKVIFDVYDSVNIRLERFLIRKLDKLILPHSRRFEQIGCEMELMNKMFIVENVPQLRIPVDEKDSVEFPNTIHLSYVGVMQKKIRGLENLLELVKSNEQFILNIAGVGDGFDEILLRASAECNRIKYYGKVQYSDALKIMKNSDFIVALYYTCAKIHKYASPNKYYESLYLGKPLITSKDTLVGSRVVGDNTGYVVGDSLKDLEELFSDVSSISFANDYIKKKNNCNSLWKKDYDNYYADVIVKGYHDVINDMIK